MSMRTMITTGIALGALALGVLATVTTSATAIEEKKGGKAAEKKAAKVVGASKETTISGVVVDLHCFMTGEYPTADKAKCTADCIKAGVPAAIETAHGLVIVSQGAKGAASLLASHAQKKVDAKGHLHEKGGVKYMDLISVTPQAEGGGAPKSSGVPAADTKKK